MAKGKAAPRGVAFLFSDELSDSREDGDDAVVEFDGFGSGYLGVVFSGGGVDDTAR